MRNVWLIGAGMMARDYIKVLKSLDVEFTVIGRSRENVEKLIQETNCHVISGGLEYFLSGEFRLCTHAIVAVGVENLYNVTKQLLDKGIKNLLIEKPGAILKKELEELSKLSLSKNANVFIAYNRRFYTSVQVAQKMIEEDGGISSLSFEFTEWTHVIKELRKSQEVKEKWFLANSTHVVDLAFFLIGKPKEFCSYTSGTLEWHPSSSIFGGAGITEKNTIFTYHANWESAGRWGVEIFTRKHRLILRPLEKLHIQKIGSIVQEFVDVDYNLDIEYKPGLYKQTKAFLENDTIKFCSIHNQLENIEYYYKIAGYV